MQVARYSSTDSKSSLRRKWSRRSLKWKATGILAVLLYLMSLLALMNHRLVLYDGEEATDTVNYVAFRNHLSEFSSRSPPKRNLASASQAPSPDGTINGYDLYYQPIDIDIDIDSNSSNENSRHYSDIHCIGEAFEIRHSWIYRSCHFQNLCFNTDSRDFVLFLSPKQEALERTLNHQVHAHFHANNTFVSIGGINTKWTWSKGIPRLKWFPRILRGLPSEGYYRLPRNAVWVPFHSMAAFNPGHLLWDDWLPIYTLLHIFQLLPAYNTQYARETEGSLELMLTRYVLPPSLNDDGGLWGSCDFTNAHRSTCQEMMDKFAPLMGVTPPQRITTNLEMELTVNWTQGRPHPRSKYICARNGAAGLGMLTDHGLKLHGWQPSDYKSVHNYGRGGVLYDFRRFLLNNVGVANHVVNPIPPYKIVFNRNSSARDNRERTFEKQMQAIQQAFSSDQLVVESYEFQYLSVQQQAHVAANPNTAMFVSACGGGAVTATFLPRGASLFLYFDTQGGAANNRPTGHAARLDWDLWNNAGYLRTHWLPMNSMDEDDDLEGLVQLVQHELSVLSRT